jgi:hypothetical protein
MARTSATTTYGVLGADVGLTGSDEEGDEPVQNSSGKRLYYTYCGGDAAVSLKLTRLEAAVKLPRLRL